MAERKMTQAGRQEEIFQALAEFVERYREDAAVRARVAGGDASDLDIHLPEGTEVRFVQQSADIFYFPLPPDPAAVLSSEMLQHVVGGVGWSGYCGPGSPDYDRFHAPCHGTAT